MYICTCICTHVTGDIERKKERKTPEAMEKCKMRVSSGEIRTHNTRTVVFTRYFLPAGQACIPLYIHVHATPIN